VVADAVQIEPVSASEFPANREINREFFDFGPLFADFWLHSASKFNHLQQNSLRNGTGNFFGVTGNLLERTANLNKVSTKFRAQTLALAAPTIGTGVAPKLQ
jgi:hypothetical protein